MATSEVETLLAQLGKELRPAGSAVHDELLKRGCSAYVKTIYIGYDLEGVMVAALYPHHGRIEVALALAEDHPSTLLIDATHLTWRTLPVAAVIKEVGQLDEVLALVDEACERVTEGVHDIERPNDFFVKSRREGDLGAHRPRR